MLLNYIISRKYETNSLTRAKGKKATTISEFTTTYIICVKHDYIIPLINDWHETYSQNFTAIPGRISPSYSAYLSMITHSSLCVIHKTYNLLAHGLKHPSITHEAYTWWLITFSFKMPLRACLIPLIISSSLGFCQVRILQLNLPKIKKNTKYSNSEPKLNTFTPILSRNKISFQWAYAFQLILV